MRWLDPHPRLNLLLAALGVLGWLLAPTPATSLSPDLSAFLLDEESPVYRYVFEK